MRVAERRRPAATRLAFAVAVLIAASACTSQAAAVVPSPAAQAQEPSEAPLLAGIVGPEATRVPAPADGPVAPDAPAAAQLTVLSKVVNVSKSGGPFVPATDGQMISEGDTVQAVDGRAVLTFPDGSTVEIEPSSAMSIDTLELTPDGGIVLSVTLLLGKSWHVVAPLQPSSSYQVKTAVSVAKVKGTQFEVDLDASGDVPVATIATSEGTVATVAAGAKDEVLVTKGNVTTVTKGDPRPAPPQPKPAAARTAITAVDASDGVVVDPLGRANGFVNGRLVLQTPGAEAHREGDRVVVTIPDPPDGVLTTRVGEKEKPTEPDKVKVETKILEKSGAVHIIDQTVTRPVSSDPTGATRPAGTDPSEGARPAGSDPTGATRPAGTDPSVGARPTGSDPTGGTRPGIDPTAGTRPAGSEPAAGARPAANDGAAGLEIKKGPGGTTVREVPPSETNKLVKPKIAPVPDRSARPAGSPGQSKPSRPQKQPAVPEKAVPAGRPSSVSERPGGPRGSHASRRN